MQKPDKTEQAKVTYAQKDKPHTFEAHKKRLGIFFVLFLVLAIGALVVLYIFYSDDDTKVQATGCSGDIALEASQYLEPNNISDLDELSKTIQNIPGYESDINCLFILTVKEMNLSDWEGAQEYFDKLKEQNITPASLDSSLQEYAENISSIQDAIDGIKESAPPLTEGTFTIEAPSQEGDGQ